MASWSRHLVWRSLRWWLGRWVFEYRAAFSVTFLFCNVPCRERSVSFRMISNELGVLARRFLDSLGKFVLVTACSSQVSSLTFSVNLCGWRRVHGLTFLILVDIQEVHVVTSSSQALHTEPALLLQVVPFFRADLDAAPASTWCARTQSARRNPRG